MNYECTEEELADLRRTRQAVVFEISLLPVLHATCPKQVAEQCIVKRSRIIAISFLCVLTLSAVFYFPSARTPNPIYQGKHLSEWLVEATPPRRPNRGTVAADEAIRQIGTNSFPFIVHLLQSRDSGFKSKLARFLNNQSLIRIHIAMQEDRHAYALTACNLLGETASPLASEVKQAFNQMNPACRDAAETWLLSVWWSDPDALQITELIAKVKNETLSIPTRKSAAEALVKLTKKSPLDDVRPQRKDVRDWAANAVDVLDDRMLRTNK